LSPRLETKGCTSNRRAHRTRDLSLKLAAGRAHALDRPDGAGKTTVITSLDRRAQPNAG